MPFTGNRCCRSGDSAGRGECDRGGPGRNWAQHGVELAAGRIMYAGEELPLVAVAAPALLDRHLSPAFEREGGDVDGVPIAVLAHLGAGYAIARPAGIGGGDIDAHDAFPKGPLGMGLHRILDPLVQRIDHAALKGGWLAEGHAADRAHRPGIAHLAAIALVDVPDLLGQADARGLHAARAFRSAKALGVERGSAGGPAARQHGHGTGGSKKIAQTDHDSTHD